MSHFFAMLNQGLQGFFKSHTLIFLKDGQSNSIGSGNQATDLPTDLQNQQRFKIWNNSTFENYNAAVNSQGSVFSTEPFIGRWMGETFNEDLHIIKYGVGGTTLGVNPTDPTDPCWLPTGFQLYQNLIDIVTAAYAYPFEKPPVIIANEWIQGESDANDGSEYYNVYEANQRTFISQLRQDLNTIITNAGYADVQNKFLQTYGLSEIPFIDVQLSNNTIYPQPGKTAVRLAKSNINNDPTIKNTFLVDTTQADFVDDQHYTPDTFENILSAQMIGWLNDLYLK